MYMSSSETSTVFAVRCRVREGLSIRLENMFVESDERMSAGARITGTKRPKMKNQVGEASLHLFLRTSSPSGKTRKYIAPGPRSP